MSQLLERLGIADELPGACTGEWQKTAGSPIASLNPTDETVVGTIGSCTAEDYARVIEAARQRFQTWRMRPAPERGKLVARLGELLRANKEPLGNLISVEMGKIRSEGLGEVQEMIDICDFAVGLSRQLYGLTIASERPRHRMMEQWHPLGPVGVITAFNFPMAVWAWNATLAAVCGDVVIWKPSPQTPLCAAAVQQLCNQAMSEHDAAGVFNLTVGAADVGQMMSEDERLPLLSFTGSTAAGKVVAARVAGRLGRTILELGGNNAITVMDDANLDLAVRAIAFGAVGTAGQRCTTTRRVFAQKGIAGELRDRLITAFESVLIGSPMEDGVLMGPLISKTAVGAFSAAVEKARNQAGTVLTGGEPMPGPGFFVQPTIVRAARHAEFPIAWDETFAPLLYFFEVDDLDHAVRANNAVRQGLSSAIFTESMRASERFVSAMGSDCGIANVNIGTSGAEIGGAFGGEKETGGGREAGSDAWKGYMRRQTCTINWGEDLPLAQGVKFL
ncbi:MAG TPA: aldehyde dehydrogenase family protein [Kofleriaceae bacterium]|nr:aldehyde dehydrogenase family protein [Kofleriaceae bacterium]